MNGKMTGLGKATADLMRVGAQIRCLSVLEVNLTCPIPKANETRIQGAFVESLVWGETQTDDTGS